MNYILAGQPATRAAFRAAWIEAMIDHIKADLRDEMPKIQGGHSADEWRTIQEIKKLTQEQIALMQAWLEREKEASK